MYFGSNIQQFQTTEPHRLRLLHGLMRMFSFHQRDIMSNETLIRSTASTDDIHQSLINHPPHLRSHRLWCLIIESHRVRQSCIRIGTNIIRCFLGKLTEERSHLSSSKRTVQSNREDRIITDAGKESLQGLTTQCTTSKVTDCRTQHDRQFHASMLHHRHSRINGNLGIQRVKDSLYQQCIYPTRYQSVYLFTIGSMQFVIRQLTGSGVTHIGRHGTRLIGRTNTTSHKARFF